MNKERVKEIEELKEEIVKLSNVLFSKGFITQTDANYIFKNREVKE